MLTDEEYMKEALVLARRAGEEGEVPVGCVIVRDGAVIATGRNRREIGRHALAHAEIEAIDAACRALGGWRLTRCTMYVTLEPCPMCAGAIVNARVPRVVYGASDMRAGAMGSVMDLGDYPLNHKAEVESGVLGAECAELLRAFFRKRREEQRAEKDAADSHADA